MTKNEIDLLKRCIKAVRTAEINDDELVEVGWINGVNPRTAKSLVKAGILVTDMPSWASAVTNTHVRLPKSDEMEP